MTDGHSFDIMFFDKKSRNYKTGIKEGETATRKLGIGKMLQLKKMANLDSEQLEQLRTPSKVCFNVVLHSSVL